MKESSLWGKEDLAGSRPLLQRQELEQLVAVESLVLPMVDGDSCSDSAPTQHHTGLAADCLMDAKNHLPLPGWALSHSELLSWAGSVAAALTCT
ncbi:hypothetical protein DUI87_17403 [Hirundo rustica rustica]|uniref:Uncharacterized protein n=1 Tax=Hirundo rustica rustica TaxID=333673 RepID=A0A3M0K439_HIRRU|nr:hypothetical protein DUI87_17403 [Hirundo rustica rustica]